MKQTFFIIFLGLVLQSFCFAQTQSKRLKIYCITEYIDGYVIKAIDTSKGDTLNIVSLKESFKKQKAERLLVGGAYNFEYQNYVEQMAAMPTENFMIRIKSTIVWRSGDAIKDRLVFGKNIKGLWIRKE